MIFWLLLLSTATSSVSSTTSLVFPDTPDPTARSPYHVDYTRIDWSLCEHDAFCLMQQPDCNMPEGAAIWPKNLMIFAKAKLEKEDCGIGIQIKPITINRWLFFLQISAPDLDYTKGIAFSIEKSATDSIDIGECTYEENGVVKRMEFRSGLPDPEFSANVRDDFSHAAEGHMLCAFVIESKEAGKTLLEALVKHKGDKQLDNDKIVLKATKRFYVDNSAAPTIKPTLVPHLMRMEPMTAIPWGKILQGDPSIEKTIGRVTTNVQELALAEDDELQRDFIFDPVNKELVAFACTNPLARLVGQFGSEVAEVKSGEVVETGGEVKYQMTGYKSQASFGMHEAIHVSCVTRACHSCSLPLSIAECDGCTAPTIVRPDYYKDCLQLTCPSDMWLFDEGGYVVTRQEKITCRRAGSVAGWFRPNGHGVRAAACAPRLDCALVSPLIDACKQENDCVKITRSPGMASCPRKTTVLKRLVKEGWSSLNSSLHCDYKTGIWYLGASSHVDFDHRQQLRCEYIQSTALFSYSDPWAFYSLIFVWLALLALTGLIYGCDHWIKQKSDRIRDERRKRDIGDRPPANYVPELDDIATLKDVVTMPDEIYWNLIIEFQLYSIDERRQFATNMLNELGNRCDVDHFLMLVYHCAEMESDPVVWRKLIMGCKIIMMAFNQVNRSRIALKLGDNLRQCANRILHRVGFAPTEGEDENLAETRNIAFNVALVTNCKTTIQSLLEEGALTRGNENISRRRQIFAFRMRGANSQDEGMLMWDTAIVNQKEEPAPWKEKIDFKDMTKKEQEKVTKEQEKAEMLKKELDEGEWRACGGKTADEMRLVRLREAQLYKYGGWREHMIYGLCSGRDPEIVGQILSKISNSEWNFSRKEILAGYRAAVEDCFDMRFAARDAYRRAHRRLKLAVPVGTTEYLEIFEMFMRYAAVDFMAEENWLVKFVYAPGSFNTNEKNLLPLATMAEVAQNVRFLMKACMEYEWEGDDNPADWDEEDPAAAATVAPIRQAVPVPSKVSVKPAWEVAARPQRENADTSCLAGPPIEDEEEGAAVPVIPAEPVVPAEPVIPAESLWQKMLAQQSDAPPPSDNEEVPDHPWFAAVKEGKVLLPPTPLNDDGKAEPPPEPDRGEGGLLAGPPPVEPENVAPTGQQQQEGSGRDRRKKKQEQRQKPTPAVPPPVKPKPPPVPPVTARKPEPPKPKPPPPKPVPDPPVVKPLIPAIPLPRREPTVIPSEPEPELPLWRQKMNQQPSSDPDTGALSGVAADSGDENGAPTGPLQDSGRDRRKKKQRK